MENITKIRPTATIIFILKFYQNHSFLYCATLISTVELIGGDIHESENFRFFS